MGNIFNCFNTNKSSSSESDTDTNFGFDSDDDKSELDPEHVKLLRRRTLIKQPTLRLKGSSKSLGTPTQVWAEISNSEEEETEYADIDYSHERITFINCNLDIEILRRMYLKLQNAEDGGDTFLNAIKPSTKCKYKELPPEETGFVPWTRKEWIADDIYGPEEPRGTAIWIIPNEADFSKRIVLLHGGGYQMYSSDGCYKIFSSHLAEACSCPILNIDYRLAPENKFPAAVEDTIQALEYVWEHGPNSESKASEVILIGDSAGGGLVYAACIYWRDRYKKLVKEISELQQSLRHAASEEIKNEILEKLSQKEPFLEKWSMERMPSKIISISPWLDVNAYPLGRAKLYTWDPVTFRGDPCSYPDPKVNNDCSVQMASDYCNNAAEFNNPMVSPMFDTMEDLPPSIIIAGAQEFLVLDCADFTEKCPNCHMYSFEGMWHDFIMYPHGCGESEEVMDTVAEAIRILAEFANREQIGNGTLKRFVQHSSTMQAAASE